MTLIANKNSLKSTEPDPFVSKVRYAKGTGPSGMADAKNFQTATVRTMLAESLGITGGEEIFIHSHKLCSG